MAKLNKRSPAEGEQTTPVVAPTTDKTQAQSSPEDQRPSTGPLATDKQ